MQDFKWNVGVYNYAPPFLEENNYHRKNSFIFPLCIFIYCFRQFSFNVTFPTIRDFSLGELRSMSWRVFVQGMLTYTSESGFGCSFPYFSDKVAEYLWHMLPTMLYLKRIKF